MKVFISWSGKKSRAVAVALRDWIPLVINSIEPFVSSKDIYAGTRWQMEIAEQLEATDFGVVCVTKENQQTAWLNFEAGALAKAVDTGRVVPLAIDLKPSDVEIPLGQFQAQPATEDGLAEVLASMNAAAASPLTDTNLIKAAKKWWPELETELERITEESKSRTPEKGATRSDRELLEETLNTVRSLSRGVGGSVVPVGTQQGPIVGKDHPLAQEVEELIRPFDEEGRIMTTTRKRALGVRARIPASVRQDIRDRAEVFNIHIDFFGPSLRASAGDEAAQLERQHGESADVEESSAPSENEAASRSAAKARRATTGTADKPAASSKSSARSRAKRT